MPDNVEVRYAPLLAQAASTFNPETRTMRGLISTPAEVDRADWRGPFLEILDPRGAVIPPDGVVPLLLNHRERGDHADMLGSVRNIRVTPAGVEADIQLSRRPEVDAIATDIADGHLRGLSVGYLTLARQERVDANGVRRITATRWRLNEVSLVFVPADPNAHIRSKEPPMPDPVVTPPAPAPAAPAAVIAPAPETRAAVNAEIRSIGGLANLDQAWIDSQIDTNATADAARAAAFEAMRTRSPAPIQTARASVGTDHTDPVSIRSAMSDALAYRMAPARCQLEGRAREFAGYRVLDMVGDLAHARGDRVNLRDQDALMTRAVGAHSTSDFPLLLSEAANKTLLANYAAAAPTYRQWASRRSFNDFRDHNFLRVGDFPEFKESAESGEVNYGTLSENRERVRAKELNTGIIVGRRLLINDDLSALADFSSQIAIRAASDENARVYGILAANPTLSDTVAIFHATHGNLAGAGTAITPASVAAAVAALRKQKSLDGLVLNIVPRFLIVGPDKEMEGRQLLTVITASKSSDVNPWSGSLTLVVDANITGNTWYIAADPAAVPSIVYGYVSGAEGPQIRTEVDFDTRAVKVAAGLDFGCGAIDFRGLYKNAGA